MIVGAFGGYAFGISRATFDIDILVDLHEEHFQALSDHFPLPRYYADPEMIRNSMNMGIMFNIIDTEEGIKADLVPLKREPEYRRAFERRVRREFVSPGGETFQAWVAHPSDIIIGKLRAWQEGRSNKHPSGILDILLFDLKGLNDLRVDYDLVTREAARISPEVLELWNQLVARARKAVEEG